LWIFGPPSSGKTALRLYFEKNGVKMSTGLIDGWWDSTILESDCGTVWMDEIKKGQIPEETLNCLCNGDFMVNVKHGSHSQVRRQM
jgi:hypothetical protein